MAGTAIEWTDETFNPWWGCEKVSPGCAHCYAEGVANHRAGKGLWGAGHGFRFMAESTWQKPLAWNRESERQGRVRFGGTKHERIRVFCASMADVFEERAELEEHRRRLFRLIEATPELDWQILTKRPEFARDWLSRQDEGGYQLLGPNVWLGVSIENARFTWRADVLREIPAAVLFVSAEPLLGSLVNVPTPRDVPSTLKTDAELEAGVDDFVIGPRKPLDLTGIDWLIAGGESGPRARPMHPDWPRELRDACADAGVAYFFKQWGEWAPSGFVSRRYSEDFPGAKTTTVGNWTMWRTGKGAAGRDLDGRTWDEFPAQAVIA